MKKAIKWIFIIAAVVIFAIDMAGFWKYKLNGTKYELSASSDGNDGADVESVETDEPKIEYEDLKGTSLKKGERIFITDIDIEEDETYTIKGLIYEEVEITKDDYTKLKSGKNTVTILGKEYMKDKIKSNNIILKEPTGTEDANTNSLYVKYDSTSKRYLVMDSETDSIVYNKTQRYVKYNTEGTLSVVTTTKKTKKTIKDIEPEYKGVEIPTDTKDIKLATLTFNKQGKCTSITIDNK